MKKKLCCFVLCLLIQLCFLNTTIFASSYIDDSANVISSSTINKVNDNFTKLEKNTGAQVKICIIKSLNGNNINNYAESIINNSFNTKKYALFIVSIKDRKNKFIVGDGLNNAINSSQVRFIVSSPNNYFKNNDFDGGIMEVGKNIDKCITSAGIKSGKLEVTNNGYSSSVKKKSHVWVFISLIIIAIIIGLIIFIYKKKKEADKDFKKFEVRTGVHSNSNFKSNNFNTSSSNTRTNSTFTNSSNDFSENSHKYNEEYREPIHSHHKNTYNHTTIINNNNNNDFVDGMIVGNMLSHNDEHCYHEEEHHHHYHHDEEPDYHEEPEHNEPEPTSGNWGNSESSWNNPSDNNLSDNFPDDTDKYGSSGWGDSDFGGGSDDSSNW